MKFLLVGLGNIGDEYAHTRHNIGFDIVDELVKKYKAVFESSRYADVAEISYKGKQIHVIKPSTYMNLSGKAVRYWKDKLDIPNERIFTLVDDLALPFGTIRIRAKGSDAGHNGLKSIHECLLTSDYARLRFGIGNNFPKGAQVHFVLSRWSPEEQKKLNELILKSVDAIECFVQRGISPAMNQFNT